MCGKTGEGSGSQIVFALLAGPIGEYDASCCPGQQMDPCAAWCRDVQRWLSGYETGAVWSEAGWRQPGLHIGFNTLDNAHTVLLYSTQKSSFSNVGSEPLHGRQCETAQASSLHIVLRQIIQSGSKHIQPLLRLLNHMIALQRLEQSVDASLAHIKYASQFGKGQAFF